MQGYLGDKAEVSLHLGTRVTGYAPDSEGAISKLTHTTPHITRQTPQPCYCTSVGLVKSDVDHVGK